MNTPDDNKDSTSIARIKEKFLDKLHEDFMFLSDIVLTQMTKALELLHDNHNENLVKLLKGNEKIIDSLDVTIKEKVINAIMLFTPRASDLRRLMAYHDMTICMERIGDLIDNIRHMLFAMDFSVPGFDPYRKLLDEMFVHAEKMLRSALFAFSGLDEVLARETILMDDTADNLERKIEHDLALDFSGKAQNSQGLVNIMYVNSISYYLERISDKAVDIAEVAVYLIEGKDIRHTKLPGKGT
ncbi:MAG: PhoU domain-containing protein [Bacteroidales bacterium]|nr:PhoU domain-containing protein [Bacteroidales bacterium]MDD2831127.1 PhoU domain-containing protein [Bacteroidales bacterium]MDD4168578.1 PhoU domain-containing protein [Bacteroidales bacterium]MDD4473988.1 PhoU domain-containing protein [Bacteroidales bacterium]